jgi:hypothetical protein
MGSALLIYEKKGCSIEESMQWGVLAQTLMEQGLNIEITADAGTKTVTLIVPKNRATEEFKFPLGIKKSFEKYMEEFGEGFTNKLGKYTYLVKDFSALPGEMLYQEQANILQATENFGVRTAIRGSKLYLMVPEVRHNERINIPPGPPTKLIVGLQERLGFEIEKKEVFEEKQYSYMLNSSRDSADFAELISKRLEPYGAIAHVGWRIDKVYVGMRAGEEEKEINGVTVDALLKGNHFQTLNKTPFGFNYLSTGMGATR